MHVAIVGCGQLARMLALAGWRVGMRFSFIADPGENSACVDGLGSVVELTPGLRGEALYDALGKPEVVTVEREHVDTALLRSLQPFCQVHPNPDAVAVSQHRGREKNYLSDLGIETAPYRLANDADGLRQAVAELGYPVLLKSCEEGYDGRGQWRIKSADQLEAFLAETELNFDIIVEAFVSFSRELSIIAVRSSSGMCAYYPLTENLHRDGILLRSIAPAQMDDDRLQLQAKNAALKLMESLDYVGVLAIEFFVVDGRLLVNELAPRVHNSGHWTQGAGVCSQFENHLLAITGAKPGHCKPACYAGMVNLLGKDVEVSWLMQGNMQVHAYNKSLRPNRKVGHVNLWHADRQILLQQLEALDLSLYGEQ
ncbi:5-(carboxyamino)imidazole ribonucleotide synthase [Agaribacterium haliotis]|uniref:5-(carboxyamino)imidazole ribonucleotide synthase n=1 Tax=Agaribacterium haliotis TaxID=2013869 RepID=UPI000BB584D6|nr:5-(carboxyamino)imidazole ribonucleotide synthase [Agaribacterium haliotis]